MTSFIIIAKDKKKREAYLADFYKNQEVDIFDITTLNLEATLKNIQSIGIEDIKKMQEKIFLKPIKSKNKAIVIDDAEALTIEAQNALLKILEEPPAHTLIILSVNTKEALLPTIISRCQITQLEEEGIKLSANEISEFQTFLEDLKKLGTGERLKKAEVLAKDKTKAIEWLEKLIIFIRGELLANVILVRDDFARDDKPYYLALIKSFQSLHTLLKTTNVNPRFAIENTLLALAL